MAGYPMANYTEITPEVLDNWNNTLMYWLYMNESTGEYDIYEEALNWTAEWHANQTNTTRATGTNWYLSYVPQKSGSSWNYKDKICQSNKTMCATATISLSAAAVAGIIGGIIVIICAIALVCWCQKKKAQLEQRAIEMVNEKVNETA